MIPLHFIHDPTEKSSTRNLDPLTHLRPNTTKIHQRNELESDPVIMETLESEWKRDYEVGWRRSRLKLWSTGKRGFKRGREMKQNNGFGLNEKTLDFLYLIYFFLLSMRDCLWKSVEKFCERVGFVAERMREKERWIDVERERERNWHHFYKILII